MGFGAQKARESLGHCTVTGLLSVRASENVLDQKQDPALALALPLLPVQTEFLREALIHSEVTHSSP
jgi:hypothetical protein